MTHRFEPMPVGIDDEGGVIGNVILRPETRRAIVTRTGSKGRLVKRIDRGAVGRAEADMAIERRAFGLGADPERQRLLAQGMFLGQAIARHIVVIVTAAIAKRRQNRVIESAAAREVAHAEREVIDHAHRPNPPPGMPPRGSSACMPWRARPFFPSLFMRFIMSAMS